jgi:allantoinase
LRYHPNSAFSKNQFETMPPIAYKSSNVILPDKIGCYAILVDNEKIVDILPPDELPASVSTTDFGDLTILPGLVDSHIHINDPGRTDWEGFRTATQAAVAGGYTTLIDMPLNSVPSTTSSEALQAKRKAAQGHCFVDWAAWGGVVSDNQDQLTALAAAGVPGFKCFLIHPGIDEFTMVAESELRAALPHIKKTALPLLVHAELSGPVDAATQKLATADWRIYDNYLRSRPDDAELAAIDLLLKLCEEFRFHLHIVHLATAQALDRLRDARRRGLPVTVETCPHYLYFAAEDIPDGATQFKCAPPIRSRANREALWQGLREGIIDLVATDHSPCPPELKKMDRGDFRRAWGGISSVSLALPAMWTQAIRRGFRIQDVVRWMAEGPAQLAGCAKTKGRLAKGFDADFVVFDPNAEWTVTEANLHFRHPLSPYLGQRLKGKVQSTFLRGTCVYKDGTFPAEPRGHELTN